MPVLDLDMILQSAQF